MGIWALHVFLQVVKFASCLKKRSINSLYYYFFKLLLLLLLLLNAVLQKATPVASLRIREFLTEFVM